MHLTDCYSEFVGHSIYNRKAVLCYTLSQKHRPWHFWLNLSKHYWILIIFGRNVTQKVGKYIFPPHITGASAIPCKTGSNEITSLRFSAVCCFANRHTKHKLSTTHRLLLIHKMMDLYVANKTMRGNKASSHLLCSHLAFSMSVIIPCQEQKMLQMTVLQLKMHQSQPNIYTLFWRFDLITRSSSEAGTQFFWVLMRRSAVTSRKRS